MANNLLSFLGWAFLPNLVTSWVQTIYYGVMIRAGDPKPQPGSPRFLAHRRVIHILVVTLYLLYTLYEADNDILRASNYYADLGVLPSAADKEIKSRFRRLAAQHHPDKSSSSGPDTANFYMHLKLASETLQDSAKRFAYERFGPDIVNWTKSKTIKDFVSRGVLQGVLPHYAIAAATMYVVGLFGYMDFGKFYRWLILAFLCTLELWVVTRPYFPYGLELFNTIITTVTNHPPYLPFQVISLARKGTITAYIALSQIGPLLAQHWEMGQASPSADGDSEKVLKQALERLENITQSLDDDAARLMDMEMAPYRGDHEATSNLQGKMREWLVQNTIRADPMVRDAVGTAFRKRRIDAPPGAKGNR